MTLWTRSGLTWKELGLRLWRQIWEDELLGRCAELAYFFLFSIFPLLLFLTTLIGTLAEANPALKLDLTVFLIRISPSPQISNLLTTTLQEVTQGSTGTKLWLSLVTAVWIASNGMIAVGRTLNIACGLKETRRWWRRRILAIALTIVFAALILAALGLLFYGGTIARGLEESLAASGFGGFIAFAWRVLQWVLILVFSGISFEMVYNYAPNLGRRARRPWVTPGAIVGVSLWLLATLGLRTYLAYFHIYSTTYGSLGAVILLLVWFYLTAFSLLMGGEVNSEIAKEITRLKEEAEERETEEEEPERVRTTVPRRA